MKNHYKEIVNKNCWEDDSIKTTYSKNDILEKEIEKNVILFLQDIKRQMTQLKPFSNRVRFFIPFNNRETKTFYHHKINMEFELFAHPDFKKKLFHVFQKNHIEFQLSTLYALEPDYHQKFLGYILSCKSQKNKTCIVC